ncbi:MAG: efflux RND transporter permease subunit [Woeseiaceae bacterium]|nr:efflux RND transporter permease subunit [Woeseiaceae bacterium]
MPRHSRRLRSLFFHNTHLLVLAVAVIVMAGLSAFSNLPRIEDPRITTRNALIITPFPGASAERVEALVTRKIEEELREVEEIKTINSTSRANISLISVELDDDITSKTNERAFSRIRDKLADAEADLPATAGKPDFDDERGASAFAILLALNAADGDPYALGLLSRLGEELADRIRNLPGAERVGIYGDTQEEITVTLDRGEMAAQGLSSATIAQIVGAADPKNAAGALRSAERDVYLEVGGEFDTVATIRNLVLREGDQGRLLRLGDVADIERGWRLPPDSVGFVNGKRAVFVAAAASADARLDRWQVAVDRIVAEFAGQLDDGIEVTTVFRQNDYTNERLTSLGGNLFLGAIAVTLVVLFGLGWRAALIVGTALPLSASATLFGLTFFGQQIHQMSIFGMIVAIGLLIDNAIVVTDEVQRRIANGERRRDAVGNSVAHLSAPLFASTVTTILGFMPIFLLPGNAGDFVSPIAISVVLALIASFLISMTIIAALAGRFVSRVDSGSKRAWWQSGVHFPRILVASERFLDAAFRRPLLTIAASLVLPVVGFLAAGTLSLQFFPPADRDQFEIEVWMPEDASLQRTRETALGIEALVGELDPEARISWLIGGSHPQIYYNRIMKQDNNAAYAHAMVQTENIESADRLVHALQPAVDARFAEAQIVVAPFAQGPPVDAPVGFRIAGPSIDVLEERGAELRRIMHTIPGVSHTRASISSRAKLSFAADQSHAKLVGLTLDDLALQLQGNLEGLTGGSVREDLEELNVRVRYSDDVRGSLADIASMPLLTAQSERWVPANTLGELRLEPEHASITRRNGERVNVIHGWIRPGFLPIEVSESVLSSLEDAGFELPPGYSLQLEGDSDAQQEAVGNLMLYLPVLLTLMITTLVLSFRSASAAATIGVVAVLAGGLGMLSLWLSGYNLGFNPMIGSAGLVGVAINGAIVVLAALRADPDASTGDVDAIVRITIQESRHVLATTVTTIAGFLPLLVFTGGEFWPPLAVVISGGVGFSVILSLLFTPAVFAASRAKRRLLSTQNLKPGYAASLLAIFLGGCAVGPDYTGAPAAPDGNWIEAVESSGDTSLEDWWRSFDDPLVERYVELGLDTGFDVRIAAQRLAEARALNKQTHALLRPTVGAGASATDYSLSEESLQIASSGGQAPRSGDIYDAGFDASWELDLFGGNRRRAEAADARVESSEARLDAIRLSVTAEIVRGFAELRGAQRRLQVALENGDLQQQSLELVERRAESGLSPELDVLNARAQLDRTRSTIPQFRAQVRAAIIRLATLTARPPSAVLAELEAPVAIPDSAQSIAPGLRGDVLRHRPDLRAAERRLAAATADIGVATAAFYPSFVLSGEFGWEALSASGLGSGDNQTSATVGFIRMPIYAGGRLTAQLEAAKARHGATLAAYEQAVALAIEESEVALTRYRRSLESRQMLASSATSSAEAADIARRLYQSGLTDFLSVLDADRRRLEAEDALAVRQTETIVRLAAAYKALGAI